MHRLVQVVRGRGGTEVSPEDVHRLFSVEPVPRRKGEQLHELARFLQPPGRGRNGNAVHLGREATQKADAYLTHPGDNLNRLLAQGYLALRGSPARERR